MPQCAATYHKPLGRSIPPTPIKFQIEPIPGSGQVPLGNQNRQLRAELKPRMQLISEPEIQPMQNRGKAGRALREQK